MSIIGIPRALAYYLHYPFWKTFFNELGHEVLLSLPTSRTILDKGVKTAVNDACIPIKVYHGHVVSLIGQVDYIFCPRLVSLRKYGDFGTETFCPKFLGLPDMIRYGTEDLPPIIDVRVDLKQGKKEGLKIGQKVAAILGNSPRDARKAWERSRSVHKEYERLLRQEILPNQAMDLLFNKSREDRKKPSSNPGVKIAVLGYPYVIYDSYLNVGLLKVLEDSQVQVYTQDMLSERTMKRWERCLPKKTFWYFSNRTLGGALYYLNQPDIDGLIHVTAFACGPDAVVDRVMEIEARRRGGKPFLSIAIDEHTGEAGVRTRIEAFLDMLRYRREKA